MQNNPANFSLIGSHGAIETPETTENEGTSGTEPQTTTPEAPARVPSDPLINDLKRPKVEYQETETETEDLNDILEGIPTESAFEFGPDTTGDEEEQETEETETPKSSGSMVNLVVQNTDWLFSSLLGWLNSRPRSNFAADREGKQLLTEAVNNYTLEVGVEFNPKAQLIYSYALVYGGGLITGIFAKGSKLVSWIFNRKKKKNRPAPDVQEAEIIEETPAPTSAPEQPKKDNRGRKKKPVVYGERFCKYPSCKKPLIDSPKSKRQNSYCSINHSAQHQIMLREQAAKDE